MNHHYKLIDCQEQEILIDEVFLFVQKWRNHCVDDINFMDKKHFKINCFQKFGIVKVLLGIR